MSVFFEKNSKLDKICLKSGAAGVSFFVLYQLISVTMKTQFEKINRLENKMKKICSMENLLRFCSKLYCVVLIFLRML